MATEPDAHPSQLRQLRGVVVGCGHMGRYHAAKLMSRDDVTLVGILDPDSPHHPQVPRLEVVPEGVDFAVVATPTRLHGASALPLLERGVPCLIEKPIGATLAEAEALAAHAHVCVNHIERFNPGLSALPEGLRPRYLRLERMAPPTARGTDVDVIHDLMIHDLDLVLHLTGATLEQVSEVRAVGVPVLTGGVDIAECWLETSDGCVATLTASRVSRKPSRHLRVVADDGTYWSVDLAARAAARVRWGAGDLDAEPMTVGSADALESMIDAFLAAVRGERDYPVSGRAGLAALSLASAVSEQVRERLGERAAGSL